MVGFYYLKMEMNRDTESRFAKKMKKRFSDITKIFLKIFGGKKIKEAVN